jgi:hypothetical protein
MYVNMIFFCLLFFFILNLSTLCLNQQRSIDAQITKIAAECEINPGLQRRDQNRFMLYFLFCWDAVRDRKLCFGRIKELIAVHERKMKILKALSDNDVVIIVICEFTTQYHGIFVSFTVHSLC